ncbi:MAG: ankyrin repeat domain-containing protein [Pseudomonadota bacterium]
MKTHRIPVITKCRLIVVLVFVLLPCLAVAEDETSLDQQLRNAVARSDAAAIETLLAKGADLNSEISGETPLMAAVREGKPDLVKLLLERGADPNIKTKGQHKWTALQKAFGPAQENRSFLLHSLAFKKAVCRLAKIGPIRPPKSWGKDQRAIVRQLLEHGADHDAWIMMWAAIHGEIDLVALVLKKGADVNTKLENGVPAIVMAAIGGHDDVVNLLKRHGAVTTLHIAAMIGDTEGVRRFLKAGTNVNGRNRCGRTPLMEAACEGNCETIRVLIDKGADVNARAAHGMTALMSAVWKGNLEAAKMLLNHGASVNSANEYGRTLLMDAACDGSLEVVKLLLDHGADMTARDVFDKTAFMRAVEMGRVNVAKLLLDKGADVNAIAEHGWSAVLTAANRRDINMMKLLLQYGAPVTLHIAAMVGDKAEVQRLLDLGVDVNECDAFGQTPLLWAASMGHEEIVKFLLDKGAAVNARDHNGWTALLWAARNSRTTILRLLIDNGADVDAAGRDGWTALMWATRRGRADEVKLLTDSGADVNLASWYGAVALDIAFGKRQITAILKSHGAREKERDRSKRGNECGSEWDYISLDITTGAPAPTSPHHTVRMDSQEVIMRLGEDSFVVDAVYCFFNTGETTTEWVGFPKQGNTCRDGRLLDPAFMRFDTWIDGRKVVFSDESGLVRRIRDFFLGRKLPKPPSEPKAPNNTYEGRLAKQVTFPGHAHTTIRLSYEDGYVSYGPPPITGGGADYIVGTASFWKDTIRHFGFTVDASGVGGTSHLGGVFGAWLSRITEDSVRCEARNYKPERKAEAIGARVCW